MNKIKLKEGVGVGVGGRYKQQGTWGHVLEVKDET